ncbi:MAG: TolB family protein [Gemmatimonadaceae bacterium]
MRTRAAVAVIALVLSDVSCDVLVPPPPPPQNPFADSTLPSLEALPFAELGRGKIAFERVAGNGAAFGGIYVVDAAAHRSYPLISYLKLPAAQPALAPDGRTVAFSGSPIRSGCRSMLQLVDADGSGVRCVGTYGLSFGPRWTPDGRQIVVSVVDQQGTSIYRQDTSLATPTLVHRFDATGDSTWALYPPVSISPTGRLVIAALRRSVTPPAITWKGLLAMNADGSGLTRLFTLPDTFSRAVAATWSLDGHRIAFLAGLVDSSATHYQWTTTVQVIDQDGTNRTTVGAVPTYGPDASGWVETFGNPVAWSLCWTSDGSRIVFSAPEQLGTWHLYVAAGVGGKPVEVVTTAEGWQDTSVSCSP